jgi:hypothetical protein
MAFYVSVTPYAYYVFVTEDAVPDIHYHVDILDKKIWIEGPYKGGARLRHTNAENLERVWLNSYIKDFRGSDSQRADPKYRIRTVAFDFEKFLSSQYLLAPNRAAVVGHDLVGYLPSATWGPAATITGGTTSATFPYPDGWVLGSAFIHATGLVGSATVQLLDDGVQFAEITVTGSDDATTDGMAILSFLDGKSPKLSFRLASDATFKDATGTIIVESTQIMAYKPEIHDAYLVLRLSTTRGDALSSRDAFGTDIEVSKVVFDDYVRTGCIINQFGVLGLPDQGDDINDNPVYDAARRLSRDCVRVATRDQLAGYAVENGKSVLWFNRYKLGPEEVKVDTFKGIGPSVDPVQSGFLKENEVYTVRGSGLVGYDGVTYFPGQQFTATGVLTYDQTGTAFVYQYDGIKATALKNSFSNEWVMFPQFKAYHPSDSSIWKPGSYADFYTLSNRCHFYSNDISTGRNVDALYQFSSTDDGRVTAPPFAPEAPSALNYVGSTNSNQDRIMSPENMQLFYKSCQIYPKTPDIESVIDAGNDQIKITFKERFQHTDEAPGSIVRDVTGWDIPGLFAETYRTDENAIREYLVNQSAGLNPIPKIGDSGAGSQVNQLPDNPYATIYPHFIFVSLMRKPYEDGNDIADSWDSKFLMDDLQKGELYLRSFCEGFVDETTSIAYSCESGVAATFDYEFTNLCFDSFGGRWVNTLPTSVQGSNNQGFGPLPMTSPWAEIFNQISEPLNKLDKARVMLPFRIERRDVTTIADVAVTADWTKAGGGCVTSGNQGARWSGSPASGGGIIYDSGWYDDIGVVGRVDSGFFADSQCSGAQFLMRTVTNVSSYRWKLYDDNQLAALPDHIRDLINNSNTGFLGTLATRRSNPVRRDVALIDDSQSCTGVTGQLYDTGLGVGWAFDDNIVTTSSCGLFRSGVLDPGSAVAGDFYAARVGGFDCQNASGYSIELSAITDNPTGFIQIPLVD